MEEGKAEGSGDFRVLWNGSENKTMPKNNTKNVKRYYKKEDGFIKITIHSFRSVGSIGAYRKITPEFLIRNYKI